MKTINYGKNNYSINELGEVFNMLTNHKLKPQLNKGYHTIQLSNDKDYKGFDIHRLLGIHYIPNPDNLPTIDHIDGNPLNNSLDNLRWASYSTQTFNTRLRKDNVLREKCISYFKCRGCYYYRVRKVINGKRIAKYFDTLEEAITYRDSL